MAFLFSARPGTRSVLPSLRSSQPLLTWALGLEAPGSLESSRWFQALTLQVQGQQDSPSPAPSPLYPVLDG